jgi:hypothetical protein
MVSKTLEYKLENRSARIIPLFMYTVLGHLYAAWAFISSLNAWYSTSGLLVFVKII